MAGIETGALNLRYGLWRDATRLHKGQSLADTISRFFIFLRPWRPAHIIMRPGIDLLQIGIAAIGKGTQKIKRRRRLTVGADHARWVGFPTFGNKFNIIDNVAKIARQLNAIDRFSRRGARLGELTCHPAKLNHWKLTSKG